MQCQINFSYFLKELRPALARGRRQYLWKAQIFTSVELGLPMP